jgi:hypothetical protein
MLNLAKKLRPLKNDERGSVIIAVGVVMIMSFLLAATLAAVYSTLTQSRTDQNRTNAFQFANAGVDDATYRLDRQELPTSPEANYTPVVVGGQVTGFTESLTVNGSQYSVAAAQDPPGQSTRWTIRSTGTDKSGRKRLAISTVSATPIFANGFFTLQDFNLTGNQRTPVAYKSSTCPNPPANPPDPPDGTDCDLAYPVPGRLGTNATFSGAQATVVTFAQKWLGFNMYGRATQAAADQACDVGNCGTAPVVAAITDRYRIKIPPQPVPPDTNLLGCNIGLPGLTTTIQPGNYQCNNLTLNGTIVVGSGGNGTGIVKFWLNGALTFASGSIVNRAHPPANMHFYQCAPSSLVADVDQPPAPFCPGTGGGSVCDAEIWAVLDTPGLPIDCTGDHQPKIYGSVIAQVHGGTGDHFDFHWDIDTLNSVNDSKFVVTNWRECPPGSTDC